MTCPDWHPKSECGNGLHGLKEGNGDWSLLDGNDWLIIGADDSYGVSFEWNPKVSKIILF